MPVDAENLTFDLGLVIELVGATAIIVAAWFYLQGQFQRNSDRLQRVESDVLEHAKASADSIKQLGNKIDAQGGKIEIISEALVRIDTRGKVLEERFAGMT